MVAVRRLSAALSKSTILQRVRRAVARGYPFGYQDRGRDESTFCDPCGNQWIDHQIRATR
jgi:hypothetical protein